MLDARDPLGTKSQAVEDMVLSNYRKRLVYVLNKADMVPRQTLEDWLAYLRKSHPTVPFKSNTQSQKVSLVYGVWYMMYSVFWNDDDYVSHTQTCTDCTSERHFYMHHYLSSL
ncbi:hypothetical protein EON65_42180, partial [archaeon]